MGFRITKDQGISSHWMDNHNTKWKPYVQIHSIAWHLHFKNPKIWNERQLVVNMKYDIIHQITVPSQWIKSHFSVKTCQYLSNWCDLRSCKRGKEHRFESIKVSTSSLIPHCLSNQAGALFIFRKIHNFQTIVSHP